MVARGMDITTNVLKYGYGLGFKGQGQTYLNSVNILFAARDATFSLIQVLLEDFHIDYRSLCRLQRRF